MLISPLSPSSTPIQIPHNAQIKKVKEIKGGVQARSQELVQQFSPRSEEQKAESAMYNQRLHKCGIEHVKRIEYLINCTLAGKWSESEEGSLLTNPRNSYYMSR
jgi:hypothetical protein